MRDALSVQFVLLGALVGVVTCFVAGIADGNRSEVGSGFADGAKHVRKTLVDGGKALRGFKDARSPIAVSFEGRR